MKKLLYIVALAAFSSCAFADSVAWMADASANFGTLNLNTGAYNQTATFGFVPAGLGEIGNTLYTADEGGTTLYSVDTTTGTTSAIGSSSISFYAFGSTTSALYMVDTVGGLWNIDSFTGASTLIGSTLINVGNNSLAVSTGSSALYVASGNSIYSINTSTAQATLIGNSGPTDFGAVTTIAGSVYGTSIINANETYRYDPLTNSSVFLAASGARDYAFGLAPIVPEPSSFALLGLAGSLLGGYAWRRKRA